jgi:hypothetical protein
VPTLLPRLHMAILAICVLLVSLIACGTGVRSPTRVDSTGGVTAKVACFEAGFGEGEACWAVS